MLNASRLYQDKLREVNDRFQQRISVLPSNGRFSSVLADKLKTGASGAASLYSPQADQVVTMSAETTATVQSKTSDSPDAYDSIIAAAAEKYDLPANLIKGVIRAESNFRTTAVSSAGAMGLMQLMPKTAEVYEVTDAFDPQQNIFAGARYIRFQLNRFGDIRLALAAYNTGPTRVRGLNIDNPDDPEQYEKISPRVRNYVQKVLDYAEQYA